MIQLNDRDYLILHELYRWRVCIGRHIKELTGFSSERSCDRRLKKLIDAGYIERKRVIYGIPGLYFLTHKGRVLIGVPRRADKIKLEQVHHDINVLDVALYFLRSKGLTANQITTEKQLHTIDGYGMRKHRPDFVISVDNKSMCVEVELNPKNKQRTEKILRDNFLNYDRQLWIVPHIGHKVETLLTPYLNKYSNMKIIALTDIL